MTKTQKDTLRQKISESISTLRTDLISLEESAQTGNSDDTDEVARMEAVVSKSVNDAALAAARRRLAALEFAATRVKDEDFGYCEECGEKIPLPRLMAMPETMYCVKCADEIHN